MLNLPVIEGLELTLALTALGALCGFVLSVPVALARLSRSWLLSACAWVFIWLFRSIPPTVLLLLLNNLGYLYETITLGIPFTHIVFLSRQTTDLISPFMVAVVDSRLIRPLLPPKRARRDSLR